MVKSNTNTNELRIAQCLDVLDQLHASGLAVREFAAAHRRSYTQLSAWLRCESRWRAAVQGMPHRPSSNLSPKNFAPVHLQPSTSVEAQIRTEQPIRIECASSDTKRTAVVYFPLTDPQFSAQWLATYLSA